MDAGEAGSARARVGVDVVGARGAVLAGGAEALVDLQGAAVAHEARQAAAVEGVDLVRAGPAVEAGIWRRQGAGFSEGRVDQRGLVGLLWINSDGLSFRRIEMHAVDTVKAGE